MGLRRVRDLQFQIMAILAAASFAVSFSGCGKKDEAASGNCALNQVTSASVSAGSSGKGYAFLPDPMVASGNRSLAPGASNLDSLKTPVDLSNLSGNGVLEGNYVEVVNGLDCQGGFGAFDANNQFLYSHEDPRFGETMSYYFGDRFRSRLDQTGYLAPSTAVPVIAHCMQGDNAFFARFIDNSGTLVQEVCIGDSAQTPGSSYTDDATVVVHELQHATTVDTYSMSQELNSFWYDEAGSMNEGISDFMALGYFAPIVPDAMDPRMFSRWALGTFLRTTIGTRGADKCPTYDSAFVHGCSGFKSDTTGFSALHNTVSYAYPDGLGWPYANNFEGPGYVRAAFESYGGQEEIHNAGAIVTGALYDVYEALKTSHGGDAVQAYTLTTKVLLEAVKHLPKPSSNSSDPHLSPVTFRSLGSGMVSAASLLSFTQTDRDAINEALTARGLVGGPELPASWASVGPGFGSVSPGVRIVDSPAQVLEWVSALCGDNEDCTGPFAQAPSGGANNGRLDPGESAPIWFDIQNNQDLTAGGVELTVTTSDSASIKFLDKKYNIGLVNENVAQISYQKVNGRSIVAALNDTNDPAYRVPTGNTYFQTDPFYAKNRTTALWVRASASVPHGKTVVFHVRIRPSNGGESNVDFPVTIN